MESKIQMCLIQINIKIMLFVVMIENCGIVDQFIKPFKPCLKQDTVHNLMTSTIKEEKLQSRDEKSFNKEVVMTK